MVVEIKKSVPVDLMMSNPSDILEILIYCRYLMKINGTSAVLGVLTDGANWNCLSFECCGNDDSIHISKYSHFTSTLLLRTFPKLLHKTCILSSKTKQYLTGRSRSTLRDLGKDTFIKHQEIRQQQLSHQLH